METSRLSTRQGRRYYERQLTKTNIRFRPTNMYLKSILNPAECAVKVPDGDLTSSHLKQVRLTSNIAASASGAGMFVIRPHKRSPFPVDHYVWIPASNAYLYFETITYDEDLSQNYSIGRHVSSLFEIYSSTLSGSQFNLSGTLVATKYQELPNTASLTYQNIFSYKRNDIDVIVGESIMEGIISLTHPDGDATFGVLQQNDRISEGIVYESTKVAVANGNGFNFIASVFTNGPNPVTLYDDSLATTPLLLPNMDGGLIIDIGMNFTNVTVAGGNADPMQLFVNVTYPYTDGTNALTTVVTQSYYVTMSAGTNNGGFWRFYIGDQGGLTGGNALVPFISPTALTVTLITNNVTMMIPIMTLTVKSPYALQRGWNEPGTLVAYQGVTAGQIINVNAVANFEVVPNASLSRQITTGKGSPYSPFEMSVAEAYLCEQESNGLKMLFRRGDYMRFISGEGFHKITQNDYLAQASGFTDFIKGIWDVGAPILAENAPIIGGMIGGPTGTAIGELAGSVLSKLIQRDSKGNSSGYGQCKLLIVDSPLFQSQVKLAVSMVTVSNMAGNPKGVLTFDNIKVANNAYVAGAQRRARAGLIMFGEDAVNRFAVVHKNRASPGVVMFIDDELNYVNTKGNIINIIKQSGDVRHEITVATKFNMAQDALSAVIMSFLQATGIADAMQVRIRGQLIIKTEIDFGGASLGLAVFASLLGYSLGGVLSGLIYNGYFYTPSELDAKAFLANKVLNGPLIVTTEIEDHMNYETTMMRELMDSGMGVFVHEGKALQQPPKPAKYDAINNAMQSAEGTDIMADLVDSFGEDQVNAYLEYIEGAAEVTGKVLKPVIYITDVSVLALLQMSDSHARRALGNLRMAAAPVGPREAPEHVANQPPVKTSFIGSSGALTHEFTPEELLSFDVNKIEYPPKMFGDAMSVPDKIAKQKQNLAKAVNNASYNRQAQALANLYTTILAYSRSQNKTGTEKKAKGKTPIRAHKNRSFISTNEGPVNMMKTGRNKSERNFTREVGEVTEEELLI